MVEAREVTSLTESEPDQKPHFLDHPDAQSAFRTVFSAMAGESDRGTVLIAAAEVDEQLRRLFEHVAPDTMSATEIKRMLSYPGPLSSLAARADVAFLTRLISPTLYHAIGSLRKLRNDVAHSAEAFRLVEHGDRVRAVFELGEDLPAWINRWTLEMLVRSFVDAALEIRDPADETKPAFATPRDALDYLAKSADLKAILEERRPRFELAFGVSMLCALVIVQRESTNRRLERPKVDAGAA